MTSYWEKQMAHGPTKHYYEALTAMVKSLKNMGYPCDRVLEVGTGWGISGSVFMEAGCKELVTIDPNMDEPYVRESLLEIRSKAVEGQVIQPIKSASHNMKDYFIERKDEFDLVFLDGRHDLESVRTDLALAKAVLRKKGVIICDDYTHSKNGGQYGVAQAVREFMENSSSCTLIEDLTGNGLAGIIHH